MKDDPDKIYLDTYLRDNIDRQLLIFKMSILPDPIAVNYLQNSPKIIRALIEQKSCFYNSIETQT